MTNYSGWYIGRIDIASVASAKAGGSTTVTDTVFHWTNANVAPMVSTANITGLVAIVGGPYATQAAATGTASADPSKAPGTGVSTSTVNSSNGTTPNLPNPFASITTALGDIAHIFGNLTSKNLWIRVVKIGVGGTLLLVGLAHLTGANNAVYNAARTVPLPV